MHNGRRFGRMIGAENGNSALRINQSSPATNTEMTLPESVRAYMRELQAKSAKSRTAAQKKAQTVAATKARKSMTKDQRAEAARKGWVKRKLTSKAAKPLQRLGHVAE